MDTPRSEPPHNLPPQLTSFVGREDEIRHARELLASTRLLTLSGAGGIGKTRLALAVAETVRSDYPDGVVFVSLVPLSDPALVASTVMSALGIAPSGNRPLASSLITALADRAILLVLDNFEHVVAAAPLVSELLSNCPKLKVLVTSRVSLHLSGEQQLPVPPLEPPGAVSDREQLGENPAVALFVQRARAIKPDFRLTDANAQDLATICRRLDGLPLAIELAAVRTRLLTPRAIVERLDQQLPLLAGGPLDAPARQQTMRATLAWSYGLLAPDEQRLLRQLSVFAGGWTLDAAQRVCDEDLDTLDGLTSLIDQSLVRQVEQSDDTARFE
ncbi:MAG: ATP-binding protein, partial [Vicinamibacterales bacterium]